MHANTTKLTLCLVGLCLLGAPALRAKDPIVAKIDSALDKAAHYLKGGQNEDGGYGPMGKQARVPNASDVGITGLVIYALAKHPRNYRPVDGPFLSKAIEFLRRRQQDDGGFYDRRDPVLRNYRTCVALLALAHLDRVEYADEIAKAKAFIKSQQYDEGKGYRSNQHVSFGAIGHSGSLRGDLSNSGYGAEALFEAGTSGSDPLWKKLQVFVSRCQNNPRLDPLVKKAGVGTTGDWGFRYQPNNTRGPTETLDNGDKVFSSYGTMTYQGLKSLLYAQVDRSDPRVRGAFAWVSKNFTVKVNPGMATQSNPKAGLQGLFYYYHTMAKTLDVYGQPMITDGRGVKHDWARELATHLLSMQASDGHWVNHTGRWWEDLPVLDTSYAMIALSLCREQILKTDNAAKE